MKFCQINLKIKLEIYNYMLQKFLHFIKYNNATVIILAVILILGGAAFAAGSEAIGQKQISVQGIDNTALLAADLDKFSMDFKIEKIEQDEQYYYATYSYLDLVVLDKTWQYQLNSKTQKISKKIKQDLGEYLAKFMAKHYEARLRELKRAQAEAASAGEQKRLEITEYGGLVGRTLNIAAKVFPGYEPVKKRELPAPENFNLPNPLLEGEQVQTDNLTQIYNDYVAAHPEIFDALSAPAVATSSSPINLTAPVQADVIMASSSPDSATAIIETLPLNAPAPAIAEPESAEVIEELPASPAPEAAPVQ